MNKYSVVTYIILGLFRDNPVFTSLLNNEFFINAYIQDKYSFERNEILIALNKSRGVKYHKFVSKLTKQIGYKRNYVHHEKNIEILTFEIDEQIFDLYRNFKFNDLDNIYKLNIMKLASANEANIDFDLIKNLVTKNIKDINKSLRQRHLYSSWYLFTE